MSRHHKASIRAMTCACRGCQGSLTHKCVYDFRLQTPCVVWYQIQWRRNKVCADEAIVGFSDVIETHQRFDCL